MKWFSILLSLGLMTSNALAAPLEERAGNGLDLFKLKISAPTDKQLDGRYLSLNGSNVGLYPGKDVSPVRVYQTSSQKKGCSQLHTYPIGIVDHALGLVGPPEMMTLTDLVNPAGVQPAAGEAAVWDTFKVSNSRLANDSPGSWRAFPAAKNSWTLKWADGSGFTTEDYMPVQIVMEAAGQGKANM